MDALNRARELINSRCQQSLDRVDAIESYLRGEDELDWSDYIAGIRDLSRREKEVMLLVVQGSTNKQIAIQLHVSPYTVKNHVHSILEKTGALRREDLIQVLLTEARGK